MDVYIASAQGGSPRRLTTHPADDASARWSRDGQWVYFVSNRTGRHEVWKRRADGPAPEVQVTRRGGWVSEESVDGQILYYTKMDLWKMPVQGGEETLELQIRPTANWTVRQNGIYYLNLADAAIWLHEFGAARDRRLAAIPFLRTSHTAGFSLSPDARHAIYSNADTFTADIMLAENFH